MTFSALPLLLTVSFVGFVSADIILIGIIGAGTVRRFYRAHERLIVRCSGVLFMGFAAQALCVVRELGLDASKVYVNGGAIAIGHPIGASGARILVTLLHEMLKRNTRRGVATLCVSGGMGMALALENVV